MISIFRYVPQWFFMFFIFSDSFSVAVWVLKIKNSHKNSLFVIFVIMNEWGVSSYPQLFSKQQKFGIQYMSEFGKKPNTTPFTPRCKLNKIILFGKRKITQIKILYKVLKCVHCQFLPQYLTHQQNMAQSSVPYTIMVVEVNKKLLR